MSERAEQKLKYFVTGASGFIGRSLCANLARKGHHVVGLCRNPVQPLLEDMGVEVAPGDIMDAESYSGALKGVDVVVHLAGDPVFADGEHYMAINADATGMLLKVLGGVSSVKRFVFVSSFGAVDRGAGDDCSRPVDESAPYTPTSDYGRSKARAEEMVRGGDIPWTIIRPTMVAGSEMRLGSHVSVFVQQALKRSLFSRFKFPGCFSVVHVDDVAEALSLVSTHPDAVSQTYFVAGDKVLLKDIYELAMPGVHRISLSGPAGVIKMAHRLVPFKIKALVMDCLWASDRAIRDLGWKPEHSGQDVVREVCRAWSRRFSLEENVERACMVTGAASGLGRAVAEQLHAKGRNLILVDRDEVGLNDVLPDADVQRCVCDLSDEASLGTLLSHRFWREPGIDEIYACAGFGLRGLARNLDTNRQADVINVNLTSRLRLALKGAQYMAPRKFGRIVFIASSSAYQPLPYMTAYAASNAGLLSLGEGLYSELKEEGVEVLTICPGGMSTGFQEKAGVKVLENEKLDTPERVAQVMLDALGSSRCTLMVGLRSKAMSYLTRIMPRKLNLALWSKLMRAMR